MQAAVGNQHIVALADVMSSSVDKGSMSVPGEFRFGSTGDSQYDSARCDQCLNEIGPEEGILIFCDWCTESTMDFVSRRPLLMTAGTFHRCNKGYHLECHEPRVLEEPEGDWMCFNCKMERLSHCCVCGMQDEITGTLALCDNKDCPHFGSCHIECMPADQRPLPKHSGALDTSDEEWVVDEGKEGKGGKDGKDGKDGKSRPDSRAASRASNGGEGEAPSVFVVGDEAEAEVAAATGSAAPGASKAPLAAEKEPSADEKASKGGKANGAAGGKGGLKHKGGAAYHVVKGAFGREVEGKKAWDLDDFTWYCAGCKAAGKGAKPTLPSPSAEAAAAPSAAPAAGDAAKTEQQQSGAPSGEAAKPEQQPPQRPQQPPLPPPQVLTTTQRKLLKAYFELTTKPDEQQTAMLAAMTERGVGDVNSWFHEKRLQAMREQKQRERDEAKARGELWPPPSQAPEPKPVPKAGNAHANAQSAAASGGASSLPKAKAQPVAGAPFAANGVPPGVPVAVPMPVMPEATLEEKCRIRAAVDMHKNAGNKAFTERNFQEALQRYAP